MGNFIAGTEGNTARFSLATNASFSTGKMENGKFVKGDRTATDKNGRVSLSTGATLDLRPSHLETLKLINMADGQDGIEESDLKKLAKNKKGNITNVFEKGNGVYIVEYEVQGSGRLDNKHKAYMQFDFETPEEKLKNQAGKKLNVSA